MTTDPRTADELLEALTRARSTNDYLIEDVVRLKGLLAERDEKIRTLTQELEQTQEKTLKACIQFSKNIQPTN